MPCLRKNKAFAERQEKEMIVGGFECESIAIKLYENCHNFQIVLCNHKASRVSNISVALVIISTLVSFILSL